MALRTLGTAATTTLQAFAISTATTPGFAGYQGNEYTPADVASLLNGIKNDQINPGSVANLPIFPGAYAQSNLLYVPNRGVLRLLPGDFVAWDTTTGWPILVSGLAAANAAYVHT